MEENRAVPVMLHGVVSEPLQPFRVLLWGKSGALRQEGVQSCMTVCRAFSSLKDSELLHQLIKGDLGCLSSQTRFCEQNDGTASPNTFFLFLLFSSLQATETDVSLRSTVTETKKSPGEMADTLSCLSLLGTNSICSLEHLWKLPFLNQPLQLGRLLRLTS